MEKSREELLTRVYSRLTKEELVERMVKNDSKSVDLLISDVASKKDMKKIVEEELLQELKNKDRIKKYADRMLFNINHDGTVNYASPKESMMETLKLELPGDIYERFQAAFTDALEKHMDDIIKKVMTSVFIKGLANSNEMSSVISTAIYESQY